MWQKDCTTVSVTRLAKLLFLVVTGLLMAACTPNPLALNDFIDNIRVELIKTKPIIRLTVTQVAAGQGDDLLKSEQDAQCSSDPILMMLGGELAFSLKAAVSGEAAASPSKISAAAIGIASSGEHQLSWKVAPISLGNLANIVFDGDIKMIQNIRTIEGQEKIETDETKKIKRALLNQAWELRANIETVADRLINNWRRPPTCPKP